jgi:uncharacterized protein (TIGR03382 family)
MRRMGLLVAGMIMSASVAAAAPHGARLTYFDDPRTTIAVSWNSDAAGDAEIRYGTAPGMLDLTATATSISQPAPLGHAFTAKLTGLEPGTTYHYRVAGHPAAGNPPLTFTTLPADVCDPLKFVLIGDNRQDLGDSANPIWGQILDETLAHSPDFFVNTGDMVLDGNTPVQWASFMDISEPGWAKVPSILTLGNHDDSDMDGDGALYNQLYELPRNPDGVEDYYSIDIGPIHFVSLNSQYSSPGSAELAAQVAFLAADLAATTQPWKVVFFHKAIYSRGNHHTGEESDGSLNASLIPILDEHDVDVVFNGHSHNYERYVPSRGVDQAWGGPGRTLPAGPGSTLPAIVPDGTVGTTYMVSGGAGALTTDIFGFTCRDAACTLCTGINLSCPAEVFDQDQLATVVYEGKHNYAVVEIDNDTMRFEVRTTIAGNTGGGNVVDAFSITKPSFGDYCGQVAMPDAAPAPPIDASDEPGADAGGPGATGETGGCCDSTGGSPAPHLLIALAVLGVLGRRRRAITG